VLVVLLGLIGALAVHSSGGHADRPTHHSNELPPPLERPPRIEQPKLRHRKDESYGLVTTKSAVVLAPFRSEYFDEYGRTPMRAAHLLQDGSWHEDTIPGSGGVVGARVASTSRFAMVAAMRCDQGADRGCDGAFSVLTWWTTGDGRWEPGPTLTKEDTRHVAGSNPIYVEAVERGDAISLDLGAGYTEVDAPAPERWLVTGPGERARKIDESLWGEVPCQAGRRMIGMTTRDPRVNRSDIVVGDAGGKPRRVTSVRRTRGLLCTSVGLSVGTTDGWMTISPTGRVTAHPALPADAALSSFGATERRLAAGSADVRTGRRQPKRYTLYHLSTDGVAGSYTRTVPWTDALAGGVVAPWGDGLAYLEHSDWEGTNQIVTDRLIEVPLRR
jgi:hypothetical protein